MFCMAISAPVVSLDNAHLNNIGLFYPETIGTSISARRVQLAAIFAHLPPPPLATLYFLILQWLDSLRA